MLGGSRSTWHHSHTQCGCTCKMKWPSAQPWLQTTTMCDRVASSSKVITPVRHPEGTMFEFFRSFSKARSESGTRTACKAWQLGSELPTRFIALLFARIFHIMSHATPASTVPQIQLFLAPGRQQTRGSRLSIGACKQNSGQ